MPTTVQHASHLDEVSAEDIVDRKGKMPNERTTKRSVHDAPGSWHGNDQTERAVQFVFELRPEP
jgi:hypothetical protein